jgi:hypothetical protein
MYADITAQATMGDIKTSFFRNTKTGIGNAWR